MPADAPLHKLSSTAESDGTNQAAGIAIRQLSVGFTKEQLVLDALNLDVQPGEIVALVGASGCGKSTLLRSIARLIPSARGEIEFHSGPPSRRHGDLAYVFQDATLLPWRTVEENVRLPLELMRQSATFSGRSTSSQELRERMDLALHSVGLERAAWSKFPRELSGGMRMRTSIARALVTDPNVLLLDEPFAALDDLLRSRLNDLILDLWQHRSRTILFVTHNIAEAVYMSHRVAVLGGGRVAAILENRLAWPRHAQQRTSVEFAAQYGAISQGLAEAAQS